MTQNIKICCKLCSLFLLVHGAHPQWVTILLISWGDATRRHFQLQTLILLTNSMQLSPSNSLFIWGMKITKPVVAIGTKSTSHPGFEPRSYGFQTDALPTELMRSWILPRVTVLLIIFWGDATRRHFQLQTLTLFTNNIQLSPSNSLFICRGRGQLK